MDWNDVITLGIGTAIGVFGWLILRSISHVDTRSERMERKQDAFAEKMDDKLDVIHTRITSVEKEHAGLRGEFNAATRPDSKSGIPKFPR